jgi:putative phosphoesterase
MEKPLLTVGIVSDTHLPDRSKTLPPGLLPALQAAQVSAILHAGDIISPMVLDLLEEVAPVTAVKGNRDWALPLPLTRTLELAGVSVGLAHGHGGWGLYLMDKIQQMVYGYHFERYRDALLRSFPQAQVIVFGHTHRAENRLEKGVLFFNPGAACACPSNHFKPQFGLLRFYPEKRIEGEICSAVGDV